MFVFRLPSLEPKVTGTDETDFWVAEKLRRLSDEVKKKTVGRKPRKKPSVSPTATAAAVIHTPLPLLPLLPLSLFLLPPPLTEERRSTGYRSWTVSSESCC